MEHFPDETTFDAEPPPGLGGGFCFILIFKGFIRRIESF